MRSPCTGLQVLQEVRITFSVQYFDMVLGSFVNHHVVVVDEKTLTIADMLLYDSVALID